MSLTEYYLNLQMLNMYWCSELVIGRADWEVLKLRASLVGKGYFLFGRSGISLDKLCDWPLMSHKASLSFESNQANRINRLSPVKVS